MFSKFKNSTSGNQKSLCTNFPLCFNSSLNSCRDLHSFNFIGRLFNKTLPLKFNEFSPYCDWNDEGNTPPFSVNMGNFSLYMFSTWVKFIFRFVHFNG